MGSFCGRHSSADSLAAVMKQGTVASLVEAKRLLNPCIALWNKAARAGRKDLASHAGYGVSVVNGYFIADRKSPVTFASWCSVQSDANV